MAVVRFPCLVTVVVGAVVVVVFSPWFTFLLKTAWSQGMSQLKKAVGVWLNLKMCWIVIMCCVGTWFHSGTVLQVHRFTSLQIRRFAGSQFCRFTVS